MHWLFLGIAIVGAVVAQALLKAGAGAASIVSQLQDWRTLAGFAVYAAAVICYILALRRIPLSVALPCTALSYIAVALLSHFAFHEALGTQRIAALALIFGGVVLLATS